jgi:hypothetical protein
MKALTAGDEYSVLVAVVPSDDGPAFLAYEALAHTMRETLKCVHITDAALLAAAGVTDASAKYALLKSFDEPVVRLSPPLALSSACSAAMVVWSSQLDRPGFRRILGILTGCALGARAGGVHWGGGGPRGVGGVRHHPAGDGAGRTPALQGVAAQAVQGNPSLPPDEDSGVG